MPATLRIARSRARPAEYVDSLREATRVLRDRKAELAAAQERVEQAGKEVMTILAASGIKSSVVTVDETRYKVTTVQGERLEVNEPGLRKAITAAVFDKLCDLKLNRTKLEVAVAEGRVDPVVVATHTTKKLNKPFIKLSAVGGEAADA
jgi:nitrogen regulatory protein PII